VLRRGGICLGVGADPSCVVAGLADIVSALPGRVGSRNRDSARREGQMIMTDNPVDLDEYRGMAAQKSTEIRRRLHEVEADQAALRRRQEEFERHAVAAPSTTWPEAAAKARYLIQLFAGTLEARDPRRQELIAKVLDDLARLSE
jgi:hypothetical protein